MRNGAGSIVSSIREELTSTRTTSRSRLSELGSHSSQIYASPYTLKFCEISFPYSRETDCLASPDSANSAALIPIFPIPSWPAIEIVLDQCPTIYLFLAPCLMKIQPSVKTFSHLLDTADCACISLGTFFEGLGA